MMHPTTNECAWSPRHPPKNKLLETGGVGLSFDIPYQACLDANWPNRKVVTVQARVIPERLSDEFCFGLQSCSVVHNGHTSTKCVVKYWNTSSFLGQVWMNILCILLIDPSIDLSWSIYLSIPISVFFKKKLPVHLVYLLIWNQKNLP